MFRVLLLCAVLGHIQAQYSVDIYDVQYEDERPPPSSSTRPLGTPRTTTRTTTTTTITSTTERTISSTEGEHSDDPFASHDWSEWISEDEEEPQSNWEESLYAASSLENPWVLATVSLTVALVSLLVLCISVNWGLCCCLMRSRRKAAKAKKAVARSQSHREWEMGQLLSMNTARRDAELRTRSEPFRPAKTLRRVCDDAGLLPRAAALDYHPDLPPLHRAGSKVTVVRTADDAVKMLKAFGGARPKLSPPTAPKPEEPSTTEEEKQEEAAALPIQV
jgi:hypothetical protein